MPATLDAIPALYRGVIMRSRLEARWALFWETLGCHWLYEADWFPVRERPRWPDFRLYPEREEAGDRGVWVEIKPEDAVPDEEYAAAVLHWTGEPFLWIAGPPRLGAYQVTLFRPGMAPEPGLHFALGRRNLGELWLCNPTSGVAVPLSRSSRLNWPVERAEALRAAYRLAMSYEFDRETP